MKFKMKLGLSLLLVSSHALSYQVDYSKTVKKIAVEANNKAYVKVVEPLTLPCKFSVIYFDLSSFSGRGYLSTLLAAKMGGKKISTLSYNKDNNDICTLSTVELE